MERNHNLLANEDDPNRLWDNIDKIFLESTKVHSGLKKTSRHSKPYWSKELTKLSEELRLARKYFKQRNADASLRNLVIAKGNFEQLKHAEGK